MKDKIRRGIVIAIFGVFLLYLIWLISQSTMIVKDQYSDRNIPLYIVLICLCLYMIFLYGIYPIHIRFSRATSLFVALFLIVISQYLANS